MSRSEDAAWAAGFFEGEGWIGTTQHANLASRQRQARVIAITIDQLDREVLDKFLAVVGVGSVSGPRHYRDNRGFRVTPKYRYCCIGLKAVTRTILQMWPYLGTVKRAQARRAFSRYDSLGMTLNQRFRSVREKKITLLPIEAI